MITGKDLVNIDYFLMQQEAIVNQPEKNKEILNRLRVKIAKELNKIKIEVQQKKKVKK